MANREPVRIVLMFLGLITFLVAMLLNTMAAFGAKSGVFQQSTENAMLKYATPITPAWWSLVVWDFIYVWLFGMFTYLLTGLCRRNVYDWMYTTPAALPYGFHVSVIINMSLNIAWLILFDRELLLPALIISTLMTFTDYMILFFCCRGLRVYGAWLNRYHTTDLWLIRVLVQNGVAMYATWATLSTLLNMTIYLEHRTSAARCDCAMLSLMLILMQLLAWFLLENFYLDEHVRYVLTIYPVVILWLTGSLVNSEREPGNYVYIFTAFILATSCIMFVMRIALIQWRHQKRPLYSSSGITMSPVDIAMTQRKVFL